MKSLGESIHEAFASRDWTPEERDSIEDVLDAAMAFARFELPLAEAAKAGVMASRSDAAGGASFAKVRAMLGADPSDPRRAALREMLEVMVRAQPVVITKFGLFERSELMRHDVRDQARQAA